MIIQILGVMLSLVNIYIVAGDMEPEVYSVVGVYQVVCAASLCFSGWGLESILCRETLYWNKIGEKKKVIEYTTQALFSRAVSCVIIVPVISIYLCYLNSLKYNDEYTLLFVCLVIGAVSNLFIDSLRNIVRSDGGYIFVQAMGTMNTTVIKMLGLFVYMWWGAMPYLYYYVLSSMPILIFFVLRCRKYIGYEHIKFRQMIKKVWEARYLWLKSDFEYVRSNIDSLLVSMLFPTSVMGGYTIYKSLEQIMRNFVEGFFDVLSQHTVQYKGNINTLSIQERKIKLTRNVSVIAIIIALAIYVPKMEWWVGLIHLNKYDGITWFILCVAIEGILYLMGKYEINAISFLATTRMNFIMSVINSVIAVMAYIMIIISPNVTGVILQQLVGYLVASILAIVAFNKYKDDIYGKLNK